jgi:hypothetical protein
LRNAAFVEPLSAVGRYGFKGVGKLGMGHDVRGKRGVLGGSAVPLGYPLIKKRLTPSGIIILRTVSAVYQRDIIRSNTEHKYRQSRLTRSSLAKRS